MSQTFKFRVGDLVRCRMYPDDAFEVLAIANRVDCWIKSPLTGWQHIVAICTLSVAPPSQPS